MESKRPIKIKFEMPELFLDESIIVPPYSPKQLFKVKTGKKKK